MSDYIYEKNTKKVDLSNSFIQEHYTDTSHFQNQDNKNKI